MARPSQRGTRIFWMVVSFTLFICICLLGKQQYDISRVQEEENATRLRIEKLQQEEQRLKKERQLLKDPQYLEKLAREEYNMVGKNEIPIFIVKNKADTEENKSK